jgi:multiple sugar transport system permease protein
MMAVALITMLPILIVFLLAQRTFIEGASISGLGGR